MTLSVLSFGYCGWGSATKVLVETFDRVEATRGYAPPIFVDTRLRRAVRAEGFREKAFENLLGPHRHRWLKELGNRAIADGGEWVLNDERGLDTLLDLAVKGQAAGRRVVFFCSCGVPPTGCHRHRLIATALPARARRRGLNVEVAEWPGGAPLRLTHGFDRKTARLLRSKAARASATVAPPTVTIPDPTPFHAVPWFSTLEVVDIDGITPTFEVLIGPPTASAVGWHLPVLGPAASKADVARRRTNGGYALLSGGAPKTVRWAETALYTLTHRDNLTPSTSTLRLTVRRSMATAVKLLASARVTGEAFGVVIGDAVDCADVLAVGRVAAVHAKGEETEVTIEGVRILPRPRSQQELVVCSTGRPIGVGFIRPYALVHAPRWLAG